MRFLFCILAAFMLASSQTMSAGGIEKMFRHRSAGDESIFFIFKQNLPANAPDQKIKSIAYDYTYVQKTDSVSLLITLSLNTTVKKINTEIKTALQSYNCEPELVYADPKKGKIEYRLRVIMPFALFESMYESQDPFSILFKFDSLGEAQTLSFGYDSKKWLKNREKLLSIIDLIKLNTGKP